MSWICVFIYLGGFIDPYLGCMLMSPYTSTLNHTDFANSIPFSEHNESEGKRL